MNAVTAQARTNIALVKYWGKLDRDLNLPATGSISMTLSSLRTTTSVTFGGRRSRNELVLNGVKAPENVRARTSRFIDRVRELAGIDQFAEVESENNFPTAAGLASSASSFAALAASASRAAGLELSLPELATLARIGSGSAPRSLLGGFVELLRCEPREEKTCSLYQVAPPDHWDVRLVVAVCGSGEKEVSSTEGMERSRLTSPYYDAWVGTHAGDLENARRAICEKNFEMLGRVTESSCFKMHAVAMSSNPPLVYFSPVTIAAIRKVWNLRRAGLEGYITIDAGPNLMVFCRAAAALEISRELESLEGVERVLIERPGPGVELLS